EPESFAELREALSDLLLSPDGGPGVLPYTTGLLEYGKCGLFALSHSRTEATELYAAAESVLGAPCAIS
ncbi:MAG TPA: hypothetical protein VFU40_10570, partial [Gemmatimonadales bacterium]|nr:hypothetical protein [Gemmatimonadales bacterium]